jgi:hypothetical protein
VPECPICSSPVQGPREASNWSGFDCPRCGRWEIAADASGITYLFAHEIGGWDAQAARRRSRLSHILRRQQPADQSERAKIPSGNLESWHLDEPLPPPSEQLDQLIICIGKNQPSHAESATIKVLEISAWIGEAITLRSPGAGLGWLLEQEKTAELIAKRGEQNGALQLRLTMPGWLRYGELMQGHVESRKVLMAMQFDDAELDRVVRDCFGPAVKRAGFELRTITEKQPAGLIDDQLRVALRTSRFVVADLTHGNNGAYWEAGFAEGLGRPVIYTCREAEWKRRPSHFDTNHLVTVIWNPANLDKAGAQLTATIRATLPAEATMAD